MARTKSTARKTTSIHHTLEDIFKLKLLDSLINNCNNNNNNNINHENLYKYLKIVLSLLSSNQKSKEIVFGFIEEFLSFNQKRIELLFKELSSIESTQEIEKRIIEFIIQYGSGELYPPRLFYEYYGIYYIDELNKEIKNKERVPSYDQVKEEKVFSLVMDKLNETSVLTSIQLIASGYFSIKALSLLHENIQTISQKLAFANISEWKKKKNLGLTPQHLKEYFKLLFQFNQFDNLYGYSYYWLDSFFKSLSFGEILEFDKMKTEDILDILNFFLATFHQYYKINHSFFRLTSDQIKKVHPVVWRWFYSTNELFPRLSNEKSSLLLTIPFKIDSKEFIDFIFDNYTKLRLIPQSIENTDDYDQEFEENFLNEEDLVLSEFVQKFKITSLELIDYFYDKLIKLREKYPLKSSIIGGVSGEDNEERDGRSRSRSSSIGEINEDYYEIKKYHLYYYLFTSSIKNCDVETIKRIDQLGLEFNVFGKDSSDRELKFIEKPLVSNSSILEVRTGRNSINVNSNNKDNKKDNNNNNNNNGKLKKYKLYSDKNSREQLFNYLSSTGFKSFSSTLFYKLFGRLLYQIDSYVIPIPLHEYSVFSTFNKVEANVVEEFKLFSDSEIQDNASLIYFNHNEDLFYKLVLNSIYKLNYPVLNLLLSRCISDSGEINSSGGSNNIQINSESFLKLISNDKKTYQFIINRYSVTSHHQFDIILNIIKLLLSKLDLLFSTTTATSKTTEINYIFNYLYKAIIQSRNCTLDKIKLVNQIYKENELDLEIDYFNFFYWCHNKSTKLSLYFLNLYHPNRSNSYGIPQYFGKLTEALRDPSSRSVSHVLEDLDISKFNFDLIQIATFDYLLEQFGRIKIFKKNSFYFLNIQRSDLYIKTFKELLELQRIQYNDNDIVFKESNNDDDYEDDVVYNLTNYTEWGNSLGSFFGSCNDPLEIQQLLDLKIKNCSYQRILESSIEDQNYVVFKFIVDSFNSVKELENLPPLDFAALFDFPNLKILKYLLDHHYEQFELFISTFSEISDSYWYTDIQFSELLLKNLPQYFSIDNRVCTNLVQMRAPNILNYYYQNGYLKDVEFDQKLLLLLSNTKDFKELKNLN